MRLLPLSILALAATFVVGSSLLTTKAGAQTLQIDSSTANWIEGFADFVRWDDPSRTDVIKVGVLNAPDVAAYLAKRIEERAGQPPLKVVNLAKDDSFEDIDILYIGTGLKKHWSEINSRCEGNGTLTIASQEGFCQSGGSVEFFIRKNRLRFHIVPENARRCGVSVSSKLLELAIEPKS